MWDESKCNRDSAGRFAEKGSGGYSSEHLEMARDRINRRISNYKSRVNLSNVEWKKFYNKIAEVQHGGYAEKLKSGDIVVTIEHNNIHTIVVYNGSFVSPLVNKTIKVKDKKAKLIKSMLDILKEAYNERNGR